MREDIDRMERILTQGFTDDELKMLYMLLQRMKENISNK